MPTYTTQPYQNQSSPSSSGSLDPFDNRQKSTKRQSQEKAIEESLHWGRTALEDLERDYKAGKIDQRFYNERKGRLTQHILDRQKAIDQETNLGGEAYAPEWTSLIDPATGQLKSQYQIKLEQFDPTKSAAFRQFQQEGMRQAGTLSPWAALQMQKQGAEERMAKDAAMRQAGSAQSQALGQLAMRGGLQSGARALSARDLQRSLLSERQNIQRQGIGARLGVSSADEEARQRQLQQLTGMETDIGKYNKQLEAQQGQYNLQNLMREIEGRRAFEAGLYGEQMRKWGAEKSAQATESGGGGGGGGGLFSNLFGSIGL